MELDLAPGSSPDSDVSIALDISAGYLDLPGPSRDSTLGHKPGSRWWPRPLTSVWTLVVLQAMDINAEPSCYHTMVTDMVLAAAWSQISS